MPLVHNFGDEAKHSTLQLERFVPSVQISQIQQRFLHIREILLQQTDFRQLDNKVAKNEESRFGPENDDTNEIAYLDIHGCLSVSEVLCDLLQMAT